MAEDAHALNDSLIAALQACGGPIRSAAVEAAFRAVPRHLFVPEVSLEQAYANDAVITKRKADGSALSSASAPWLVAWMLGQLDVRAGQRVLEIGAGTGYNAALLAALGAQVTTVEYDEETADRARRALAVAGFDEVVVVTGDGADGYAAHAPYDRLIVTTGAWDVPAAWLRQLAPDGRLVVPLRLPGWSYSLTFEAAGDHWQASSFSTCGFIAMEGPAGFDARRVAIGDAIVLRIEDARPVDAAALEATFAQPRQEVWTGVTVSHRDDDPYAALLLWLAGQFPGFAKFTVLPGAVDTGKVSPLFAWGGAVIYEESGLAYLTNRRAGEGEARWELGVVGHGPAIAERVAEQVEGWRQRRPRIELHPAGVSDERLADAYVIDKRDSRLAIWF